MSQRRADELIAELAALADAHALRRRAFDGCRRWLEAAAADGPGGLEGWSAEEIVPQFRSCALVFGHGLLAYPFMETRLDLCVRDAGGAYASGWRPIGYYRLITRLDGADDDDYFVIEAGMGAGG